PRNAERVMVKLDPKKLRMPPPAPVAPALVPVARFPEKTQFVIVPLLNSSWSMAPPTPPVRPMDRLSVKFELLIAQVARKLVIAPPSLIELRGFIVRAWLRVNVLSLTVREEPRLSIAPPLPTEPKPSMATLSVMVLLRIASG